MRASRCSGVANLTKMTSSQKTSRAHSQTYAQARRTTLWSTQLFQRYLKSPNLTKRRNPSRIKRLRSVRHVLETNIKLQLSLARSMKSLCQRRESKGFKGDTPRIIFHWPKAAILWSIRLANQKIHLKKIQKIF